MTKGEKKTRAQRLWGLLRGETAGCFRKSKDMPKLTDYSGLLAGKDTEQSTEEGLNMLIFHFLRYQLPVPMGFWIQCFSEQQKWELIPLPSWTIVNDCGQCAWRLKGCMTFFGLVLLTGTLLDLFNDYRKPWNEASLAFLCLAQFLLCFTPKSLHHAALATLSWRK